MAAPDPHRIALLVSRAPYASREPRAELDAALAALAMDFALDVYFNGAAVLQLAESRDSVPARLPPGYKAWSSLAELGEVRLFAELGWMRRCDQQGIGLIGPPRGLPAGEMARHWRACGTVWSL